jgi:hypothetical protein
MTGAARFSGELKKKRSSSRAHQAKVSELHTQSSAKSYVEVIRD